MVVILFLFQDGSGISRILAFCSAKFDILIATVLLWVSRDATCAPAEDQSPALVLCVAAFY